MESRFFKMGVQKMSHNFCPNPNPGSSYKEMIPSWGKLHSVSQLLCSVQEGGMR